MTNGAVCDSLGARRDGIHRRDLDGRRVSSVAGLGAVSL